MVEKKAVMLSLSQQSKMVEVYTFNSKRKSETQAAV